MAARFPSDEVPVQESEEGGRSELPDSGFLQNAEEHSDRSSSNRPRHFNVVHSPTLSSSSSGAYPRPIEAQEETMGSSYFCGNQACEEEREKLRHCLDRAAAEKALLLRENTDMKRRLDAMQRTLTCSQIVEGHSHLMEKCQELQRELNHVKRINDNTAKADENKTERVQILQARLEQLQSNLNKKEVYIELLHEQLAGLFQQLRLEESDAHLLKVVKEELQHQLRDAQAENQGHLEELWDYLAQIKELKETMSDLRDELELERNIRKEVVRRSSSRSKDKNRPLSEPVFPDHEITP